MCDPMVGFVNPVGVAPDFQQTGFPVLCSASGAWTRPANHRAVCQSIFQCFLPGTSSNSSVSNVTDALRHMGYYLANNVVRHGLRQPMHQSELGQLKCAAGYQNSDSQESNRRVNEWGEVQYDLGGRAACTSINGTFNFSGCRPVRCAGPKNSSALLDFVDYSSCSSGGGSVIRTGDTCTPQCIDNYHMVGSGTQNTLTCMNEWDSTLCTACMTWICRAYNHSSGACTVYQRLARTIPGDILCDGRDFAVGSRDQARRCWPTDGDLHAGLADEKYHFIQTIEGGFQTLDTNPCVESRCTIRDDRARRDSFSVKLVVKANHDVFFARCKRKNGCRFTFSSGHTPTAVLVSESMDKYSGDLTIGSHVHFQFVPDDPTGLGSPANISVQWQPEAELCTAKAGAGFGFGFEKNANATYGCWQHIGLPSGSNRCQDPPQNTSIATLACSLGSLPSSSFVPQLNVAPWGNARLSTIGVQQPALAALPSLNYILHNYNDSEKGGLSVQVGGAGLARWNRLANIKIGGTACHIESTMPDIWSLVVSHEVGAFVRPSDKNPGNFFRPGELRQGVPGSGIFAVLDELESFRDDADGLFTFKLEYPLRPSDCNAQIWQQETNPALRTYVVGYTNVVACFPSFHGLVRSKLAASLLEGGCSDIHGWVDLDGDGCQQYVVNGYCGAAWISTVAVNGVDASSACCASCSDTRGKHYFSVG